MRVKNDQIKESGCCRQCINEIYGLNLTRKDVLIYMYPKKCSRCGQVKNIVYGAAGMGKWKLFFGKKPVRKGNGHASVKKRR